MNYETEYVKRVMLDGFPVGDFIENYALPNEWHTAVTDLAAYYADYVWEVVQEEALGFSRSVTRAFLEKVDWNMIAEIHLNDHLHPSPI